jgi:glycosyltransferase involved in cell wall biosynthesis
MRALHVLHVTPYFENAWAYGGIPRVVSAQAHALAAAGHHVTVATTDVHDAGSRLEPFGGDRRSRFGSRVEQTADGIEVRVFPNVSNTVAYRWQFYLPIGFARYMRANARHFDVAHLHACHNLLTAVAARHLRRAGVPYVVQPNGTALRLEQRRAAKMAFDILLARHVMPDAAAVVAVTEWERCQLQDAMVHGSRIRLVPNPLAPMPPFPLSPRGSFRRRYDLTDGPLVVYLGVLSPRKQPDVLAKAVAELGRPDVQLVFAGNDMGFGRRTRGVVRRLGLDPQTRFTGLTTGSSRFLALADADIVVYPSRDEVFGLVPLEALQTGTPVIVCNDGGCGGIISDIGGGLLVTPGDAHALSAAIATMFDDLPRWREDAVRAGTEAARRFHPDLIATQLEGVYHDAIASS